MRSHYWALTGCVLAFLGVAAGAFGAHALKTRLEPEMRDVFEVAVRYQQYHALALLAVGMLASRAGVESRLLSAGLWLLLTGIVLFSGSLYALSLTGSRWLGAVTPLGGAAFLVGWGCLALVFFLRGRAEATE